ncbi:hypothetical protein NM688_g201 [Phlebia brevispora]|uniref:Uncharacterized protein n=1 Tax=Phlebia brevispora TaxID=194682 RepID=A0ACC1TF84_9APHY|nr:hypothetical protein NM688_g201 [Phlebia brevispora]
MKIGGGLLQVGESASARASRVSDIDPDKAPMLSSANGVAHCKLASDGHLTTRASLAGYAKNYLVPVKDPAPTVKDHGLNMELYYDILLHIAGLLEAEGDYISLFQCSLVNKNMNLAVSRVLYRRVVLDPPPSNAFRLGRQDQELTPTWKSAGIENNAPHVTELQVTGFLVQRPASQNNFSDVLCDSLHKWKNLQTVTLAPKQYHPDVFYQRALCAEKLHALTAFSQGLTSVTLLNPTRVILQDLPEWLSRLEPTLTELHMMDNCGSVTPGVLKALIILAWTFATTPTLRAAGFELSDPLSPSATHTCSGFRTPAISQSGYGICLHVPRWRSSSSLPTPKPVQLSVSTVLPIISD